MLRNRIIVVMLGTAVVFGATASSAMAQDKKQAKADWKAMDELCTKFNRTFRSQSTVQKMGATFRGEWDAWKKAFVPLREQFASRYGDDHRKVLEYFEGMQKPLGVEMDAWQVANLAYDINIEREEKRFTDWMVQWGQEAYRKWKVLDPKNAEKAELKLVRAEDMLRYFELAKEWNPDGDYDDYIEQAKAAVAETRPLWEKALGELKWPGHNKDFSGPGTPDELAKAAIEFLKKHPKWSKPEYDDEHTPIAACVTGSGWEVWKKAPLTHEPTQYSVSIFVAFKGKKDPKTAYCYHMVFYTAEEGGVKKGLPFRFANSKQYAKYRMLMSNVPTK